MTMKNYIFILMTIVIFACEKDINPNLDTPSEIVVVDAWINDKAEPQNIYISRSQPYFDNALPEKIPGATIVVFNELGQEYFFAENDSAYSWVPSDSLSLTVGMLYTLAIDVEGQRYVSVASMNRTPVIDSIEFAFEPSNGFIPVEHYLAEFVARDFEGEGDTYWIKAWKNGQYLNKPNEINIAYDAGFTPGGVIDGQVFIQPIQSGINPIDFDPDNENTALPPYEVGDSVHVEIHSIDFQGYRFLIEMQVQTDRSGGFGALFAQPLANVPTNIVNANETSEIIAAGFFQVSSVSGLGARLDEDLAQKAREEQANE